MTVGVRTFTRDEDDDYPLGPILTFWNGMPATLDMLAYEWTTPDDLGIGLGWIFPDEAWIVDDVTEEIVGFMATPFDLWYDDGQDSFLVASGNLRPVPEPGTVLQLGTGLLGLAGARRHRKR